MRKKILLILVAILSATIVAFCLTACGDNGGEKEHAHSYVDGICTVCGEKENDDDKGGEAEHTHSYAETVIAPTCTEKGYTLHKCSCGDEYTDDEKPALGHKYADTVVAPTCTGKGYTLHKCKCGDKYKDSEKSALGHKYDDGVCTVCGYEKLEEATGLEYTLSDDGTYYIVTGIGTEERMKFAIPTTYNGKPVKEIGERAFSGCNSLTSITIPDSVTSIGWDAFLGCISLEKINVRENNANYSSIDGILYNKNRTEIIYVPSGIKGAITIPNSVTSIDSNAFWNCSGLTSIKFNGTKAQWSEIKKTSFWKVYTGNFTVHCTDGDLTKEEA